ncbi:MAG: acyl-CoA thioesterase [Desulfobacterales bacterium]|jgi:acyl-CoA hydrolase|nr:acyl-CoA thioesterase [Desulfobacterales bacterium]
METVEKRQREITFRFLAQPTDINFGGKVHGGAVMKWIDQTAYACAVSWSGEYCVTVYVGGTRFYRPIHIGNLVEVRAKLIYTGRTSMHVSVDVSACDMKNGQFGKTTRCIIILVAVDENIKPVPVKPWVPVTEEDVKLEKFAKKLMKLREGIEAEVSSFN